MPNTIDDVARAKMQGALKSPDLAARVGQVDPSVTNVGRRPTGGHPVFLDTAEFQLAQEIFDGQRDPMQADDPQAAPGAPMQKQAVAVTPPAGRARWIVVAILCVLAPVALFLALRALFAEPVPPVAATGAVIANGSAAATTSAAPAPTIEASAPAPPSTPAPSLAPPESAAPSTRPTAPPTARTSAAPATTTATTATTTGPKPSSSPPPSATTTVPPLMFSTKRP